MTGKLTIEMSEVQSVQFMLGVVFVIYLRKLGPGFDPGLLMLVGC